MLLIGTGLLVFVFSACSSDDDRESVAGGTGAQPASAAAEGDDQVKVLNPGYVVRQEFPMEIELTSSVFNRIRRIPIEYTCTDNVYYPESGFEFRYGEDKSPPLAWSAAPEGTQSFAIIMDDPDVAAKDTVVGGRWVHWVIWNIPAAVTELDERGPHHHRSALLGPSARQGVNDYNGIGWSGPCPGENVAAIQGNAGKNINTAHAYIFRIYALDSELDLQAGASKQDLLKAMDGHILVGGEVVGEYINKKFFR